MTAALLQILSNAAAECSVTRPETVINNADEDVRRLLQMSRKGGRQMVKMADWTVLQRLHTITTDSANTTGEYALPDDYGRLLGETVWDRSGQRPMAGPVNPQEWQNLKSSGFGGSNIYEKFRIYRASTGVGRSVYIHPVPTVSAETRAFEYISKHWCVNEDLVTTQDDWVADSDVAILDQDLLTLDLIVRFKRSIGLDFTSEAQELEDMLSTEKGQDRPSPAVSLNSHTRLHLIGWANVPEQGYGS
jgi:hypothetical protein